MKNLKEVIVINYHSYVNHKDNKIKWRIIIIIGMNNKWINIINIIINNNVINIMIMKYINYGMILYNKINIYMIKIFMILINGCNNMIY